MKDTEILYLNDQHEKIVESHLKTIKKLMYFATEDVDGGKYKDFLHIVNSIFLYSNNFHKFPKFYKFFPKNDNFLAKNQFFLNFMT